MARRSKPRNLPLSQDFFASGSDPDDRAGPTLEEHVTNYLAELAAAGRSSHTLRAYAGDLRSFVTFCGGAPLEGIALGQELQPKTIDAILRMSDEEVGLAVLTGQLPL